MVRITQPQKRRRAMMHSGAKIGWGEGEGEREWPTRSCSQRGTRKVLLEFLSELGASFFPPSKGRSASPPQRRHNEEENAISRAPALPSFARPPARRPVSLFLSLAHHTHSRTFFFFDHVLCQLLRFLQYCRPITATSVWAIRAVLQPESRLLALRLPPARTNRNYAEMRCFTMTNSSVRCPVEDFVLDGGHRKRRTKRGRKIAVSLLPHARCAYTYSPTRP